MFLVLKHYFKRKENIAYKFKCFSCLGNVVVTRTAFFRGPTTTKLVLLYPLLVEHTRHHDARRNPQSDIIPL